MMKPSLYLLTIAVSFSTSCAMVDSEAIYDQTSAICVVEQHDKETARLFSRLEFVPEGLLSHKVIYGEHHHSTRRNTYDRAGRLSRTRITTDFAAGQPEDRLSWRRNGLPVTKDDKLRIAEGNFEYGPAGGVVRAEVDLTTTIGEEVHHSAFAHDYTYDERGRTTTKKTSYGPSNGLVRSRRIDYTYNGNNRLQSRFSTSYQPASNTERSYRTTFGYDSRGNLTEIDSSGNSTTSKREYDADNRLISLGGGDVFTWDDSGRLVRSAISRIETSFSYDDQGRLHTTRFDRGGGLITTYSESCPAGFADPAFTPNVDGFLFYEGREPTLRLW
jgi:YD repeat-containing protein